MIVIPMAGLSRRFREAGYDRPKYMLPVGDTTLFAVSVESFAAYFTQETFLFVYRDINDTDAFVRDEAARIGITHARFVPLDSPTDGQAQTVAIGVERGEVSPDEPITIFNIDTIRPHFRFPATNRVLDCAGYLEVFRGSGSNWSFVGPDTDDPGRVARTTEKDPISNLCSTGLYHFGAARYFSQAYADARAANDRTRDEYYVAPLYNRLIAQGLEVRYDVIDRDAVTFAGVPSEYIEVQRMWAGRGASTLSNGQGAQ